MKKSLNVRERLMAEPILLGGEIMTRQEVLSVLQCEGVQRGAIDWAVFRAKPLSGEEIWDRRCVALVLVLRWRCQTVKEEEK